MSVERSNNPSTKPVGILRNGKKQQSQQAQRQASDGSRKSDGSRESQGGMEPQAPHGNSTGTVRNVNQQRREHSHPGAQRQPPQQQPAGAIMVRAGSEGSQTVRAGTFQGGPPPRQQQHPPYYNNDASPPMTPGGPPDAPRSGPVYLPSQQERRGGGDNHHHRSPRGNGGEPYDHTWNAASSPPSVKKGSYQSHTESETSPESEVLSDQPSHSSDPTSNNPMTEPSAFDDKGRCAKHPHIKLRKKKMLGGWKVLLVNCPDCCIEEMLRMRREGNTGSGGSKTGGRGRSKTGRTPKEGRKRRSSKDGNGSLNSNSAGGMPPISQLTIRTHGRHENNADSDVESTGSSASELTYGTMTSSQQQYNPYVREFKSTEDNSGSTPSGPHRVTRMPFTDAYGDRGWYTGEVASGSGLP